MPNEPHKPTLARRAIGWLTTLVLYVILIRVVIDGIRRPPTYDRSDRRRSSLENAFRTALARRGTRSAGHTPSSVGGFVP